MTNRFLAYLATTAIVAVPAHGQNTASQPSQQSETSTGSAGTIDSADDEAPIVITGGKLRASTIGDIPPENILDSRDVRATGATTINELLDAIAPQIGSAQGRGGERPVLLLDGKRISGFQELRDIPTEAIERVDIMPEEVALKYGYGASQKVVNIVLRQRFRSTVADVRAKAATAGGYVNGQGDLTRLMIGRNGRTSINLHAEGNNKLTEDERNIVSPGGPDSLAARTLLGSNQLVRGTATVNRTIFGDVSATGNVQAEHSEGEGLLGLGADGTTVLARNTKDTSLHAGFALNGSKVKWQWSVIGNGDADWSRTGSDRADPSFPRSSAKENTLSGDISALANGALFKLPAGDATLAVKAGASAIHLDSARAGPLESDQRSLGRSIGEGSVNFDLPISRRNRPISALGNLTLNANAGLQQLSDFGTLARYGAGANWSPVERLNFLASWSHEEGAPTIQQLGDPILETPQTRIFDFVTGQTVFANVITGGNPALQGDRRRVLKLGANWQPLKGTDLRLRADYVHAVIDRPIQSIFGPTPALEAAFPDRFVRDPSGTLLSADLRPLNFGQSRRDTLQLGFDFSKPLKSSRPSQSVIDQMRAQFRAAAGGAPPGAGAPARAGGDGPPPGGGGAGFGGRGRGGGGGGGFFGGGSRGRLTFSLLDTITFKDQVTIAPGLPLIDYLHGDAVGSGGGTPRHKVEARAGWSNNGLGLRLSANWRSGTEVRTLTAGTLDFAPLATFDVRAFANLGERPELVVKYPWLRGASIRLEVTNILDEKQRVRDSNGLVPSNYQPDLLDPLGRTIMISFRKLFLPSFASMRREFQQDRR